MNDCICRSVSLSVLLLTQIIKHVPQVQFHDRHEVTMPDSITWLDAGQFFLTLLAMRQGLRNFTVSVQLSVPFAHCSSVRRVCCCGPGGQDINRSRRPPGAAAAALRSAANVSSVMFTANGRGSTQTCFTRSYIQQTDRAT